MTQWPVTRFGDFLTPNRRPYRLGAIEDADLVGMRLYGLGPFHREHKLAMQIAKKTHFVIRAGDVIYNKLFAWKGTFGVVPNALDGMFVSDKFPTYELDRERVDERFLGWYFRYPPLWDQAKSLSTGSAALSKLTLNPPRLLNLTMPIPPLLEQRRIVERIEAIAEKVRDASRLRKEADEAHRALAAATLNQLARSLCVDGVLANVLLGAPRNGWSASCDNVEGGVAVLALSAVTGFQYRQMEYKRTSEAVRADAHYWLAPGDLLITRSNTPDLVGHAAIYDGVPRPCIYPDLMMKLRVNPEVANSRFVWYWLQGRIARDFIRVRAVGTSPTMKKISQGIVSNIPFPKSLTLDFQVAIVKQLDCVQAKSRELTALYLEISASLDAVLPALLNKAFKGEM